jgi:hypothetical protein
LNLDFTSKAPSHIRKFSGQTADATQQFARVFPDSHTALLQSTSHIRPILKANPTVEHCKKRKEISFIVEKLDRKFISYLSTQ